MEEIKKTESAKRVFWQFPWGYGESLIVVSGLLVVGFALELSSPLDLQLLREPISRILGAALLLICAFAGLVLPNNRLVRWLGSVQLSVALIAGLLVLSLIMGLTPQLSPASPHDHSSWLGRLSLNRLTSSWAFILVYGLLMVSLGIVVFRRVRRPGAKFVFLLNHLGLWLCLAAGALGSADRLVYSMWVEEGQVEWRGRLPMGLVVELPLAIQLNKFHLEEYPPKLTIINSRTGIPLTEDGKTRWYQVDPERPASGRLGNWTIMVKEYHQGAIRAKGGVYLESPRLEAAPAALIRAVDEKSGEIKEGWITDGGQMQPFQVLNLTDELALVMAKAEPKSFLSEIKVFSKDGASAEAALEVNKPFRTGDWMVYQSSYNDKAGRLSRHSGFELVYDPWLPLVYAGLVMMTLGALVMIWRGRQRA